MPTSLRILGSAAACAVLALSAPAALAAEVADAHAGLPGPGVVGQIFGPELLARLIRIGANLREGNRAERGFLTCRFNVTTGGGGPSDRRRAAVGGGGGVFARVFAREQGIEAPAEAARWFWRHKCL